ncbi:MAG: hypothetical protein K0S18_1947 [Anaerocolumna sp.]|jgi:hypothetical protein|nr:hypothetical protein [Anaerocolumna sp.]
MIYKIIKLISNANLVNYWQFVLNADNTEYSTTDLAVLESKLLELMTDIPLSKLKVVTELSVTDDLTIA